MDVLALQGSFNGEEIPDGLPLDFAQGRLSVGFLGLDFVFVGFG